MVIDLAPIRAVLPAFLQQGLASVYVVACCGRVYVGAVPATTCRTCRGTPANHAVRTDGSDLDTLA